MHTKSLAVLKRQVGDLFLKKIFCISFVLNVNREYIYYLVPDLQLIRKKMVKSAKEGMKDQASHSEIYGRMHAVFVEMDNAPSVSCPFKLVFL